MRNYWAVCSPRLSGLKEHIAQERLNSNDKEKEMAISKKNLETNEQTQDNDELFEEQETANEIVKGASKSVATTGSRESVLSEEEMSDLDFGFGAFPTVTLDKGEFECSDGDVQLGNEFDCKIVQYKAKYFYRSYVDQDDVEFFYSFDKEVDTQGEQVADRIAEWNKEGRPPHTVKKYLEVTAILHGGDHDGTIVLLSVSPSSVARFSGYVAGELNAARGLHYKRVVTTVGVGAKITKAKFPFRPWAFSFKSES